MDKSGRAAPLSSILLPVDDIEAFARAARLTGQLARATAGRGESRIDLLHVVTGTFLGELMKDLDLASGETPATETMQALHRRHLDNTVRPLIETCSEMLRREVGKGPSATITRDGDAVKIINSMSREEGYSTLIMSRRNLAEKTSGKLLGSVVAGVMHRHTEATIYLVGDRSAAQHESFFSRCLIAVDDSPAGMNSVAEAGTILSRVNEQIEKVHLVHVLDQSCYYDEDGVSCMEAGLTGQRALEAAGNLLIDLGVDRRKIKTVIHFGKPGAILAEEVIGNDATLIFLGRRDRSRMAQVFLGSVCTDIIQNCMDRTLVLSS